MRGSPGRRRRWGKDPWQVTAIGSVLRPQGAARVAVRASASSGWFSAPSFSPMPDVRLHREGGCS